MKTTVFKLEVTLGNDAMRTPADIAEVLSRLSEKLKTPSGSSLDQYLFDLNGNYVGETKTVTRRC